MTITRTELQNLGTHLPLFGGPDATAESWLHSESVQSYLNLYHINFSLEIANVGHRFGKFAAAGFDIALHHWQVENALGTVFVIHGFTDNVGLMQHLIRHLLTSGYSVVAFDLPGHGLSSGARAAIDNFDQYRDVLFECLELMESRAQTPWFGVGQSTGGAVWINYLCSFPDQEKVQKTLLLAPLVRAHGWSWLQWFYPMVRFFTPTLQRKFVTNSHDPEFLKFIEFQDPLQPPTLPLRWVGAMDRWAGRIESFSPQWQPLAIVQGDQDVTVDWRYNLRKIQSLFPDSQLTLIEGAAHQLVNEAEPWRTDVMKAISGWLKS